MISQAHFDRILSSLNLSSGSSVLLAVSGGVDSMVMACLFSHSAIKCRLAIAHCNFHLRGADSDSDEALVREYAGTQGVIFKKKDFCTKEYAASKGLSIEMAARELRYSWFEEVCQRDGYVAVAVAHNQNDNAADSEHVERLRNRRSYRNEAFFEGAGERRRDSLAKADAGIF